MNGWVVRTRVHFTLKVSLHKLSTSLFAGFITFFWEVLQSYNGYTYKDLYVFNTCALNFNRLRVFSVKVSF